jgi:hypothetical protein
MKDLSRWFFARGDVLDAVIYVAERGPKRTFEEDIVPDWSALVSLSINKTRPRLLYPDAAPKIASALSRWERSRPCTGRRASGMPP